MTYTADPFAAAARLFEAWSELSAEYSEVDRDPERIEALEAEVRDAIFVAEEWGLDPDAIADAVPTEVNF